MNPNSYGQGYEDGKFDAFSLAIECLEDSNDERAEWAIALIKAKKNA